MDGWEIALLVLAGAFLMLVLALMVPILRLRHTVDAATRALNDINERTGPLLGNVNTSIVGVNEALAQVHTTLDGVNIQLAKVDTITGHAQSVTANVANLAGIVSATAANPLVKIAAFGYGVRRAAAARRHADEEREVRATVKQRRKAARAARKAGQVTG